MTASPSVELPAALPLTPFETLMWCDDRPGYPMVFFIEATLRGALHREAFASAARQATQRHPLLRSHIVNQHGRNAWQCGESDPEILWLGPHERLPPAAWTTLNLTVRPGLRLIVQSSADEHVLLLQFHHASTDGIGGINFLGDLLGYYHALITQKTPRELTKSLDTEHLPQRGDLIAPKPSSAPTPATTTPPRWWHGLRDAWRFSTYGSAAISAQAKAPSQTSAAGDAPHVTRWLTVDQTQGLRDFATAHDVQVNDVLLRDLFLTIDDWNASHSPALTKRKLRIVMPVNMRTEQQRHLPAANVLSYGFLHRTKFERDRPAELLAGIAWETKLIQTQHLGNLFLSGIGWVPKRPWLLKCMLRMPGTFAAAVLSNVGDPSRRMRCKLPREDGKMIAGNLVLERIAGTPPVRPGTRLSMAVMQYADQLSFMALGCRHALPPLALAAFLDSYLQRLQSTASAATKSATSGEVEVTQFEG